jgi:hypothetical protein
MLVRYCLFLPKLLYYILGFVFSLQFADIESVIKS